MFPLFLMGLTLLSSPPASVAQGEDSCPPGSQVALSRVQSFLGDSAWADSRQDLGISVSADRARVLSDDQDPSTCQTLSEMFPDPDRKARSFYKAGSYYFVMYEWEAQPDGDVTIGPPGFIVLDSNFEALQFYV